MARGKIEKRGVRRRSIRPVILIVTEGAQTEPKYFEHFRTRNNNVDIRVVGSRSSAGESDYMSLVRKAVEYKGKNQLSKSNGDTIWIVADGDVNYNNPNPLAEKEKQLQKARKVADAKDIKFVLSNPCFELWYLLHYQYTSKFLGNYNDVSRLLKKYIINYEKSTDVYSELAPYTAKAIENSRRLELYQQRNGQQLPFGIYVNPFTDVFKLVELLSRG